MEPSVRIGPFVSDTNDWGPPRPRRPLLAGQGRARKVALIGGANTVRFAPWHDPTWEIWAHASARKFCEREPDLLFDLHPKALWGDPKKKFWDSSYATWLKQNHIPIMMQHHYKEVPASIKYPFAQIIHQFRPYFTNHVAWMTALALTEGVSHIGIYGCHYDSDSEYGPQRGCAEYWIGYAEGQGVQVVIPPTCDLVNNPSLLYGYESHPNGVRDPSYSVTVKKALKTPGTTKTMTVIDMEKAEGRPPLREIGMPPAWERSGHTVQK